MSVEILAYFLIGIFVVIELFLYLYSVNIKPLFEKMIANIFSHS